MKRFVIAFAVAAILSGCIPLQVKLPDNVPGNAGQETVISNWVVTTIYGKSDIGYYRTKTVENQSSNISPVLLIKKPWATEVYEVK